MADEADLARELLGLAADDLTAARALVDVPSVTDAIVGFHAQQATEKALKAALAAAGRDFPFTHNIDVLRRLCGDGGIALPAALDKLDLLTPYAVAGRYGARSPGPVDRATALDFAAKAVAWAREVVEGPPSAGSSDSDLNPAGV
jgi:HEPN domain-containing protein